VLEYLGEVTIAPITTTVRDIPSEVVLSKAEGMSQDYAVNCDRLQKVSQGEIGLLITFAFSAFRFFVIHASSQTCSSWLYGGSICLRRPPGSSLFLHARGILVNGAFLFLAIDRLKGAATAGPVQG